MVVVHTLRLQNVKPIHIAMMLSAMMHLAILLAAEWWYSDSTDPSTENSLLLVTIEPPGVDAGFAEDQKRLAQESDYEPAIPQEQRERAQNIPAEPTTYTPAISPESQPALPPEQVDIATVIEESVADPVEIITTVAVAEPLVVRQTSTTVRPASVQAPLSPKQEKMLQRKITAWTEKLDKVSDTAKEMAWKYKGQEYVAKFTRLAEEDDMGMQRVIIEVRTVEDGKLLSTRLHMKRLAFSNYAQFVNRWDPSVQIHNDELDGRFHSNSEINLAYDREVKPMFHGQVTTTARRVNVTNNRGYLRRDEIFSGGLKTGVRVIRLPKHFIPFPSGAKGTGDRVHHFDEDAHITFNGDGSYVWHGIESESLERRAVISKEASYLVAARKVKLHVKGTVNGKVLVYSPERIIIDGDLVYAQDPENVSNSDDYLGLVSDKYVEIAPPDVTGPGDLAINAAIYAKRRFAVKGYRVRNDALLYIYGSLSAGSLSATEPRYYTRIRFDPRLEELRPPGFPVTDRFEVESWDRVWDIDSAEMLH